LIVLGSKGRKGSAAFAMASLAVVGVFASGCGRAATDREVGSSSTSSSSAPTASASSTAAAGDFGAVKNVCRPGNAPGGSGRGLTADTIRLGVLGDPGSPATPGLGQEFFDVADAFSKWCNNAGGINGRKIVVDHLDAKLFNTASMMFQACQKDFMLVGGGNALDEPGVKPRTDCKLGMIPGYTVSPEATNAPYQVAPTASTPLHYQVGVLRLLADAYPESKQGLGIAGSSLASLTPQGLRAQEAWTGLGYKVSTVQPRPALVDNYRSWMEQFKSAGAKADFEITGTNAQPVLTAINDTGFEPSFLLMGQQIYNQKTVQAAKQIGKFPPTYVNFTHVPWELSDQYPTVAKAKKVMKDEFGNPDLDEFSALGFNAWLLWATSATACGDNLTQDCILQKAGSIQDWTAGDWFGPTDTDPTKHDYTDCTVIMKLTTDGWVYDKDVTKPNKGVLNCSPDNLVAVKSYGG
jgi:ABC-type branched-subunit amino acid transport system substrate-binding protein